MFEDLISSFEITKVTFVDMWEILEAKGYFWECENHAGMETKRKREREREKGARTFWVLPMKVMKLRDGGKKEKGTRGFIKKKEIRVFWKILYHFFTGHQVENASIIIIDVFNY